MEIHPKNNFLSEFTHYLVFPNLCDFLFLSQKGVKLTQKHVPQAWICMSNESNMCAKIGSKYQAGLISNWKKS